MTTGATQLIVRAMRKTLEMETVWLSVALDIETAERLRALADICHADQASVAASLLHDVLKDDEDAHAAEVSHHHHVH